MTGVELHVDDDAFVRAPVALVYPRLTDIGAWSQWWPGVRTTARDRSPETWAIELRAGGWRRPLRLVAQPGQWRHDAGFRMQLDGDLDGWCEFWLEEGWGGTVVHHLLVATTVRRRPVRVLRDYRRVVRRGLWRFKDDVQSLVRVAQGQTP